MEALVVLEEGERAANDVDLLTSENYEKLSKDSMERFLKEVDGGKCDLSEFTSVFARLVQARIDPPLEIVWCFALSRLHEVNSAEIRLSDRVSFAHRLFQTISSCLASCSGAKSAAGLVPLVPEVFEIVVSVYAEGSGNVPSKSVKKYARKIGRLMDGMSKYLSLCCLDKGNNSVSSCNLLDFISAWSKCRLLRVGEASDKKDKIRVFFPFVGDEIPDGIREEECDLRVLAGIVISEMFLLRMCLKVIERLRGKNGIEKDALRKELTTWAVGCLMGYPNLNFFGNLLRQLLLPTSPVTSLLDIEEEKLLRRVLYDAVILPEFSFLNPETVNDESVAYLRSFLLTKLVVTHKAIQLARSQGDHARAVSYTHAFSQSNLPTKLLRCIENAVSIDKSTASDVSTPQGLLKWIFNLKDKGLREFIDNMSKLGINMATDEPHLVPMHQNHDKEPELDSDLFYINVEKEEKSGDQVMQTASVQFLTAAQEMNFAKNRSRKRKDLIVRRKSQVKFQKFEIDNVPLKDSSLVHMGDSSDDSGEVDNPSSDEDSKETE